MVVLLLLFSYDLEMCQNIIKFLISTQMLIFIFIFFWRGFEIASRIVKWTIWSYCHQSYSSLRIFLVSITIIHIFFHCCTIYLLLLHRHPCLYYVHKSKRLFISKTPCTDCPLLLDFLKNACCNSIHAICDNKEIHLMILEVNIMNINQQRYKINSKILYNNGMNMH